MGLGDYLLAILETTGNSFVVGGSTALAGSILKGRATRRFAIEQPLRSGGELAKHTMLYSAAYYGMSAAGLCGWAKLLGSSFVASLACGMRNGARFGVRSGLSGVASSFVHEVVNKLRKR